MTEPRIIGAVQSRMGSSRLPGKALEPVGQLPLAAWVCRRVAAASRVHQAVIATTTDPGERPMLQALEQHGVQGFRGSTDDIVARFHDTAEHFDADVVVRIWGDCPFVDPAVVDRAVARLLDDGLDYCANFEPARKTYPVGLDLEVWRTTTLARIRRQTDDPFFHEFPAEYFRAHPDVFSTGVIRCDEDHSEYHLTVDYPEDLAMVRAIVARIEERAPADPMSYRHVVDVLQQEPSLMEATRSLRRNIEYKEKLKEKDLASV